MEEVKNAKFKPISAWFDAKSTCPEVKSNKYYSEPVLFKYEDLIIKEKEFFIAIFNSISKGWVDTSDNSIIVLDHTCEASWQYIYD